MKEIKIVFKTLEDFEKEWETRKAGDRYESFDLYFDGIKQDHIKNFSIDVSTDSQHFDEPTYTVEKYIDQLNEY